MRYTARYLFAAALSAFQLQPAFALSGVETEAAVEKPVSSTYVLEGVIEAVQRTTISAQTSGNIKEIRFDVNDYVNKNQIVVVIDNTQQKSSLAQAKAAEKEALARVAQAEAEYDRVEEVFKKKVVSKASFDTAKAELAAAKARLESAVAEKAKAQEQLDYTLVRAPFSGILTARLSEPGESVSPGTQLVSGVSLEQLRVLTNVPQSIFKAVKDHHKAIVITDDSEIVSREMTFFPFADPNSHGFDLRVYLPQSETGLRPGMFVKVAMEVYRENKTVIPFSAVAFRGEVTGVYVEENDSLHFRHVRLGRRLERNEVVVVAGIYPGDAVVTDPVRAAIAIKQDETAE